MPTLNKRLLKLNGVKLWQHQKSAIREIAEYIESESEKAFLVKMPTGTGKTGVFSCLTRVLYDEYNYIILSPSSAIKQQIITEISDSFWNKISFEKSKLSDYEVKELMPSSAKETLDEIKGKKFILVSTIKALHMIYSEKKYKESYDMLKEGCNCIIFDEGHKEPAYSWAEAVRSFNLPTVLFSATPYRNDYKVFNIDKSNFYGLSHKGCVEKNILRELNIVDLFPKSGSPEDFVNELLSQLRKHKEEIESIGVKNPKVIIRCITDKDIIRMVRALKKLNKKAVGIHDNFKDGNDYLKDVPPLVEQTKFEFFVHQNKLLEGIDNPDFVAVAIYKSIGNTRQLIQQVGRVLRNPMLKEDQMAFLFVPRIIDAKSSWTKYLDFDENLCTTKQLFDVTDVLKVNEEATSLYFEGSFRDIIQVRELELSKSLVFQTKLNAYKIVENVYDFDGYCSLLIEAWERNDFNILKYEVTDDAFLILYIQYENSPIVKDGVFIEQTLAVTYLRIIEDNLYFYDSEHNNPFFGINSIEPLNNKELTKLLVTKKGINSIYLQNTDIGNYSLRSKEISAYNLESTGAEFADSTFAPSRVDSIIKEDDVLKKRYLGFVYGRISDRSSKRLEFDDFNNWVKQIHANLHKNYSSGANVNFFNRYAEVIKKPSSVLPVFILLDIDDEIITRYTYGDKNHDLYIDNKSVEIIAGRFSINVNGSDYEISITFNDKRNKYILESVDLNHVINPVDQDDSGLLNYLNQNQSFRIIIEGNQYIYASNCFYAPSKDFISRKRELDLSAIFYPHTAISKIVSEKGDETLVSNSGIWHKDTLFGLIARKGIGYGDKKLEEHFKFDYLVCDDLDSEIADFIAINIMEKKIVFIHAKCANKKLSASAFHDICGQVAKNLNYLMPSIHQTPTNNIKKWNRDWSWGKIGSATRMIPNSINGNSFWIEYKKLLRHPSTTKEVWMFVGDTFDFTAFKKEINRNKIELVKPEVIQLIYLLRSTWSSVTSSGANLKVFC